MGYINFQLEEDTKPKPKEEKEDASPEVSNTKTGEIQVSVKGPLAEQVATALNKLLKKEKTGIELNAEADIVQPSPSTEVFVLAFGTESMSYENVEATMDMVAGLKTANRVAYINVDNSPPPFSFSFEQFLIRNNFSVVYTEQGLKRTIQGYRN